MHDDYVTRAEADRIADRAAERAADRALKHFTAQLGINADDFDSVEEARKTWQWARSAYKGSEQIRHSARRGLAWGAAGTVGTGFVYFLWRVVEAVGKSKGGP